MREQVTCRVCGTRLARHRGKLVCPMRLASKLARKAAHRLPQQVQP